MDWRVPEPGERSRVAWWLLTLALATVLGVLVYSYAGTLVFGLFLYYGSRPAYRRLVRVAPSRRAAAAATLLGLTLPIVALAAYLVIVGLHAVASGGGGLDYAELIRPYVDLSALTGAGSRRLIALLVRPDRLLTVAEGSTRELLSTGVTVIRTLLAVIFHLFLSFAIAFYLLRDDHRVAAWFRSEVADRGSSGYAYVTAVDRDLATVYFGNFLVMIGVAALSLVTYYGFNLLAPPALTIPLPAVLALFTGVASIVPILVGKIVYVPIGLYLGALALRGRPSLAWPVGFLVFCFFVLDLIPQTFLLPRIAGRKLHVGLVLFAYIFGSMLFGWYGLFLGPLLLVLIVHLVRIVFAELIHGDRVEPDVTGAEDVGSRPETDD